MRRMGIRLLALGIVGVLLAQTPSQAAPPSVVGSSLGVTAVGHPPGPPGHARYWHHPPVHRPPVWSYHRPAPPRWGYRAYPPVYYYSTPPFYYYDRSQGSIYYYTPRGGISITW